MKVLKKPVEMGVEKGEDWDVELNEDEDETSGSHSKLLNAVSQLYNKQRVSAPKRSEPSAHISEFHLTGADPETENKQRNKLRIHVNDLSRPLARKPLHEQIPQKIKNLGLFKGDNKTLPAPVEKIHADKATRVVGFKTVKNTLNRWDPLIQRNRAADQLKFPLVSHDTIEIDPNDFLSTFKKPTELELEMASILKGSAVIQEQKKEEETDFPLTLEEMIAKRKMMARVRAQESYRIAKATRQNKIKSKKYHRILRQERTKEELKTFEALKEKDPEAALEKLQQLERARAHERATLRHKNTGQWARTRAIRAKYDQDARIELAEQLAKSRELTQKLKLADDSSDDDEQPEEEVEISSNTANNKGLSNNPWVDGGQVDDSEIKEFVSGFKEFCDMKKRMKEQEEKERQENELPPTKRSLSDESSDDDDDDEQVHPTTLTRDGLQETEEDVQNSPSIKQTVVDNTNDEVTTGRNQDIENLEGRGDNTELEDQDEDFEVQKDIAEDRVMTETKSDLGSPVGIGCSLEVEETTMENEEKSSVVELVNTENLAGVCKRKRSARKRKRSSQGEILNRSGTWTVICEQQQDDSTEKPTKKSMQVDEEIQDRKAKKDINIERMFRDAEQSLKRAATQKLNKLKEEAEAEKRNKKNDTDNGDKENNSEDEDFNKLAWKKSKMRSELDEAMIEFAEDRVSSNTTLLDIKKLVATASDEPPPQQTDQDIDPEKFLKMEPKRLATHIQEFVTAGEDALDDPDEEQVADQQKMNLAEAFADDDVVDEFRKEKEEDTKEDQPKNIDLRLPGWGSWGGAGVKKSKNITTRKRRRFVTKVPLIKRADANRPNIMLAERGNQSIRKHMVSDLPYYLTSVKEFEATVRAPLGTTWVTKTAHDKLTQPPVITKMGTIIEPMDESQLAAFKEEQRKMKSNHKREFRKSIRPKQDTPS